MDYNIEVRVIRRPGSLDFTGNPEEVQVYKTDRQVYAEDGMTMEVYDMFDDIKLAASSAVEQDLAEERSELIGLAHGSEEDRLGDAVELEYYAKKYND